MNNAKGFHKTVGSYDDLPTDLQALLVFTIPENKKR